MRNRIILVLAVVFAAGIAIGQNVLNYMEQGGARWEIGGSLDIASGGEIDIESGGALTVASGGELDIESGGTLEVGGTLELTGTIAATTDITVDTSQTATLGVPNKMLQTALPTGFALHNQFVGIPKLGVTHIATLKDGTATTGAKTLSLANCSAVVDGTETDDASFFITGSTSYKYVWAAAVAADDGIDCLMPYPASTDPTHFGFLFRTDVVIVAGDIDINFDDGGVTDGTISTFATTVVDEWHWVELDITTACAGECSAVDGIEFLATAQAATNDRLDGASMYIDSWAMWKDADELAIGDISVGGMIDFAYALKDTAQANTVVQGVEWTSHFINYQAGADAVVTITDLQNYYATTLEALN